MVIVSRTINQNAALSQEAPEHISQVTLGWNTIPGASSRKLFNLINGEPAEQVSLLRTQTILGRSRGCSDETAKMRKGGEAHK